jgi:hypothetical protein
MTMAGKEGISPGDAEARIELFGLDALCDAIEEGETFRHICRELDVARGSLNRWIAADDERSRRVLASRVAAAESFDEMALEVLTSAKRGFALSQAREVAHHLRWKAQMANPRRYGSKVAVGGSEDLPPIETKSSLDMSGLNDDQLRALASIAVHRG